MRHTTLFGHYQWCQKYFLKVRKYTHTYTKFYSPFFRDHPGEPVTEENFWTLWCKGRLTEADTLTIRLVAIPSGLTSAHLHHPPIFLQAGSPSCRPTNSVKALEAKVPKYKFKILSVKCTCKCKYIYLKFSELQNACRLGGRKGIWPVETEWCGSISDELEAVRNVMFAVK